MYMDGKYSLVLVDLSIAYRNLVSCSNELFCQMAVTHNIQFLFNLIGHRVFFFAAGLAFATDCKAQIFLFAQHCCM